MGTVGVLAYGSLINDPGPELLPAIARRIDTMTPFPVEYGRLSKGRGGAPTVVPHPAGRSVRAQVLVLRENESVDSARNILWRREAGRVGTGERYRESTSKNAVLVQDWKGFEGVDHVLYTDFNAAGKIEEPVARELALAAVRSVRRAREGKDGLNYLAALIESGVETPLTADYVRDVLAITGASSLRDAISQLLTERA